jgi:hypothetical protein
MKPDIGELVAVAVRDAGDQAVGASVVVGCVSRPHARPYLSKTVVEAFQPAH